MNLQKQNQKLPDVSSIHLLDRKTHEGLLSRKLTKKQLGTLLDRIKQILKKQTQPQILTHLNELRRELRSKYSIDISRDIIDHFILTSQKVQFPRSQIDFQCIDKQIKSSLAQISRKKYFLNSQNKKETITKKILSAQKRKRWNVHHTTHVDTMPQIRSLKNFDEMFVRDKLAIFQGYLEQQEINRFQQELVKKLEAIDSLNYGKHTQRLKHYTVFDLILQRVFALIQEDTKNIEIRTKFQNSYRRMKEEMVAIVTNEQEVTNAVKKLKNKPQEYFKNVPKQNNKKNYFQVQREKQDLTAQIEDTLQGAKRHLKEAFIKRGRPDFAYELELVLDNRKTPIAPKRLRF